MYKRGHTYTHAPAHKKEMSRVQLNNPGYWTSKTHPTWEDMLTGDLPETIKEEHPNLILTRNKPYFGVMVTGIDLSLETVGYETRAYLEAIMAVHGIIIFKGQGGDKKYFTAKEQLNAVGQFGTHRIFSTHAIHKAAEHEAVFRLSNNEEHGFVQVGGGFHHDGLHNDAPFGHVSYHLQKVPLNGGPTSFNHMGNICDQLTNEHLSKMANLFTVNAHSGNLLPMLFPHPVTKRLQTFANPYQLAGIIRLIPDNTTSNLETQLLSEDEIYEVMKPIYDIANNNFYMHIWEEGDMIMSNNITVCHRAEKSAFKDPESNGLRILHRVTLEGRHTLVPNAIRRVAPWLDDNYVDVEGKRDLTKYTTIENKKRKNNENSPLWVDDGKGWSIGNATFKRH